MAENKHPTSRNLLNRLQKQRNAEAVKLAEENGYFFDPTTEDLLSRCSDKSSLENGIETIKLVHLSSLRIRSLGDIPLCTSLTVCLLANNSISKIDGLVSCKNLIRLDLHSNQLVSIPGSLFWESLCKLQVLHLHDNPLGKLETVQILGSSPCLSILTLYDTPLSLMKNYRHHTVNSIWTLKALDKHVVSDEEIIEDAVFASGRFAARCTAFKFDLCPKTLSDSTLEQEMSVLRELIAKVNSILAKHSPVLILQRCLRGYLVRRQNAHKKKPSPVRSTEIMAHPPSTPVFPESPAWTTLAEGTGDFEYYSRKPSPRPLAPNEALKASQFDHLSTTQDQSLSQEDHFFNINIQKLKSGILSCLQAESVAMKAGLAEREGLGLMSRKVKGRRMQNKDKNDGKPKPKRIKDTKQFFGPMVPTYEAENEESEQMGISITDFRLKGRKPELLITDATTEMILSKKEAGEFVREAEAERVRRELMQPPMKVKRNNFTTAEQRLYNKTHGTMGLFCLMAVHKAYEKRDKAEHSEARIENILGLRDEKLHGKARMSKYHDKHRSKVLKSRDLDTSQIQEKRQHQDLQRLNLLDKLQEQKVHGSDLSKLQKADHFFMQGFVCQQTSVSNALLRYDYQAHTEDSRNQRQKYVSTLKKNEQEQQAVVKKYLERRKMTRQSEVAKLKSELTEKLLNEATQRIMEARDRVAQLKSEQGSILPSYSFARKKCSPVYSVAANGTPLRDAVFEV